jgi:hypothetical protein
VSLVEMTKSSYRILLYRATRDGFYCEAFHSKCDGKRNTVTIIKNNLDYVFGGLASHAWHSSVSYIKDPNAFLFSLKRDGVSYKDKFKIEKALFQFSGRYSSDRPTFGLCYDIYICNQSNTKIGSYINFGRYSYNLPDGYAKEFLTGNANQWTTTEIEVYQIIT